MQLNGSQIVIECLKEQGVDTVFGYPGGAILNIYDELYRHQDEIRHILTSHEQGASHAADGYARATGKVGVCMATSGPGATNLVTGIATAYMDSVPMVAITCNVGISLLGKDSFQEIDIAGVAMPITKYSFIVKDVKDLAPTLRRAFSIARSGRPGPVLVDIVKSATSDVTEYTKENPVIEESSNDRLSEENVQKAIELIQTAKKPMIFVGGGAVISGAQEELKEFAKKVDAPVTDSLMGKGAFDGTDERYVGMLGMHGTKTANLSLMESDLLIVVGSRFSDRVAANPKTFAQNAKIIQIDIDEAEINKNVAVDISLIGDVRKVLTVLNQRLDSLSHTDWMQEVAERKVEVPLNYNHDVLTGPYIIEKLDEITNGEAIIATEVGQHQMWAAQYYKYKHPRTLLTSGGLGTMGYGLGAAIGAKTAYPDKVVVNIAGDGCFRMNMNEIATATRSNIPVIELVFNNHVLGMVRQWQTLFYGERYSHTVLNDKVDFVKLAEAMGAKAYRITKKEEVEPILKEAIALGEPVVIDCIIDSDDKVFPMVAPGKNLDDAFDEQDLLNQK
ncbi:biosynthetic-type acetolactate synthase large subunit [Jutongia hominis]|jgi:acetolactate synthase-1/2/3 large subunit|uniref:Acetolactate synthase n=1 Tax=Jutongia hominis TaxID=2763664 RepID=A0ABR7MW06_9FIRM|nr:biosynthetic-type acetolactate synthase large subunit [Jutongia hominis]MBC8557976.1 biosynthetic-type acetolactate synthase large subunit [Jutongia hominis]PWL70175.1 MAG: biosynthetic-type acetolactate synthase large subunit [Clostridiaceae bacterium]